MKPFANLFASETQRQYRDRGYVLFRKLLPVDLVDTLAEVIRTQVVPYEGPLLRQDNTRQAHDFFPGTSLVRNPLANAHLPIDAAMRPLETALGAVVTAPQLADRLRELDDAEHYNIHQTLVFFASQTTALHLDSWGLDTAPHGFAHTLWIPLQDMDPTMGVPGVIPWPRGKLLSEADLGLSGEGSFRERYEAYQGALVDRLMSDGPDVETPLARRGDVIVWTSLTPHFTWPARHFPTERLSIQVLLRPLSMKWGDFVTQPKDHPTNRHIRATDRFSFFVNEQISQDCGITGSF